LKVNRYTVSGVIILLIALRFFQINGPLVNYHGWNQVSTASMVKHLYYDWDTFLKPTIDMFSSLTSNSTVYAQEMPLYHIPIALLYHVFGVSEWPGRVVSIAYGMIGLWYWFLLSKRLFGEKVAFLTLIIAGISPLNWYYHQTIMSDNSMVTAMIAGFYYFYLWLEGKERYLWYSLLWTIAAGLFKSYGLVIGVGYLSMILLRKQYYLLKSPKLIMFAILACLPSFLWIYHARGLGEGRNEFTKLDQILHLELLLSWKFYERMIFSRLIDQLLTQWMAIFCGVGIYCLNFKEKQYHPLIAWMFSCIVYLVIVQHGNYVHDYYQLPFVPGLALLSVVGIRKFKNWTKWRQVTRNRLIGCALILFALQSAKYTYNHGRYDIGSYNTGIKISEMSQPNDRVIAFDLGAGKQNQLVYYSNLKGWYTPDLDLAVLEQFRRHGASWLGVNMLEKTYSEKYQNILQEVAQMYPKVWEDRTSVDRYNESVVSQVYDLRK